MAVPILKQGDVLIASIQAALTDTDVIRLQEDIMERVGRFRSRGISTRTLAASTQAVLHLKPQAGLFPKTPTFREGGRVCVPSAPPV